MIPENCLKYLFEKMRITFCGSMLLTYDDTSATIMQPRVTSRSASAASLYVVEIGPVEGGFEALSAFLAGLRPKENLSYLISAGFLPAKAGSLPSILRRAARMPVVRVRNGTRIQPKYIYLSPPLGSVRVEKKRFRVLPDNQAAVLNAAPRQVKCGTRNDYLTGLPDRGVLRQRLRQACKQYRRNRCKAAILLVDLSPSGSSANHGAVLTETVIMAVARRLESRIRAADTLARLGAASFGILLRDFFLREEVKDIAERMVHAFEEPFQVGEEKLTLQASIGIALHPDNSHSVDGLFHAAELSTLAAKRDSGNTFRFYDAAQNPDHERLRLGEQLRGCLDSGLLLVVFQPIIDMSSGRVTGAEALLRLRDPSSINASPLRIVEIAEESGQIHRLGDMVLSQVCRQIRKWDAAGIPPIHVAVNLSATQLGADHAAQGFLRHLEKSGVAPGRLQVEITESVLLERSDRVRQELSDLQKAGVALVLDDFGTGYCSLTYLRQFPVNCLKVDLSFVHGVGTGSNDEEIIAAMIGLAHALGMGVVAEGVETKQQAEFLRHHNCDMAQGFYFGKPMTAGEFTEFMRRSPVAGLHGYEAAACGV